MSIITIIKNAIRSKDGRPLTFESDMEKIDADKRLFLKGFALTSAGVVVPLATRIIIKQSTDITGPPCPVGSTGPLGPSGSRTPLYYYAAIPGINGMLMTRIDWIRKPGWPRVESGEIKDQLP